MKLKQILVLITLIITTSGCCERITVPCSTITPHSAVIPVIVDWSQSGLTPSRSSLTEDQVHRLSLRFYPTNGGKVIVRYLEANLTNDEITMPTGRYSVIAINEAVEDKYWEGAITFTNVNDFDLFTGELVTDEASNAAPPKRLAAWSLGNFEVTENMAAHTKEIMGMGDTTIPIELTEYEEEQMIALTKVVMMPRTRNINVRVAADNLGSAQRISASVKGLSRRVNIVTGASDTEPVSHSVSLDSFDYASRANPDDDGVASGTQLCFAHSGDYTDDYTLDLEVYMNDGTKYDDEEQLSAVDVADQVTSTDDGSDYEINHAISLPVIENGSIGVDDWVDGGKIELN